MRKPPVIDHDPNERRFTKGEAVVITILTAIILIALGISLKWVANSYGIGWLAVAVAVELAIIFPLAFWLDRRR